MINKNDPSDLIKFLAHTAWIAACFAFIFFIAFLLVAPAAIKTFKAAIIEPVKKQLDLPTDNSVKIRPTKGGMFISE